MNLFRWLYKKYREIILRLHSMVQLHDVRTGNNNNVFGKVVIICRKKLAMGDNCTLNHSCYINASNGVSIGDDVTLSAGACIVSTGIDCEKWVRGEKRHITDGKIVIGDHVWIGANATILPGISITGEYVVIAANAVVTHSIEENRCIYAGVPARKIKHIQ